MRENLRSRRKQEGFLSCPGAQSAGRQGERESGSGGKNLRAWSQRKRRSLVFFLNRPEIGDDTTRQLHDPARQVSSSGSGDLSFHHYILSCTAGFAIHLARLLCPASLLSGIGGYIHACFCCLWRPWVRPSYFTPRNGTSSVRGNTNWLFATRTLTHHKNHGGMLLNTDQGGMLDLPRARKWGMVCVRPLQSSQVLRFIPPAAPSPLGGSSSCAFSVQRSRFSVGVTFITERSSGLQETVHRRKLGWLEKKNPNRAVRLMIVFLGQRQKKKVESGCCTYTYANTYMSLSD